MKYSDTELAWAYLARVAEGPCAPLADLIAHVGPEYAAEVIRNKDVLPDALILHMLMVSDYLLPTSQNGRKNS